MGVVPYLLSNFCDRLRILGTVFLQLRYAQEINKITCLTALFSVNKSKQMDYKSLRFLKSHQPAQHLSNVPNNDKPIPTKSPSNHDVQGGFLLRTVHKKQN